MKVLKTLKKRINSLKPAVKYFFENFDLNVLAGKSAADAIQHLHKKKILTKVRSGLSGF